MTNEETIRELQWMRDNGYDADDSIIGTDRCKEAFDMAIEALEKQIPKKLVNTKVQRYGLDWLVCPSCDGLIGSSEFPHCPWCGQAID